MRRWDGREWRPARTHHDAQPCHLTTARFPYSATVDSFNITEAQCFDAKTGEPTNKHTEDGRHYDDDTVELELAALVEVLLELGGGGGTAGGG